MRLRFLALALALAGMGTWVGACANGLLDEPEAGTDGSIGGDGNGHPDSYVGADGSCISPAITCYVDGGKVCANVQTDPNHCGMCAHSCFTPVEGCDGGVCVSACGSKTECIPDAGPIPDGGDAAVIPPPYCADLLTDDNNCGQCGNGCGGSGCDAGVCNCTHGMKTFAYTGAMVAWVVPCGSHVTITAAGGQGANANDVLSSKHTGGLGGSATGTLAVKAGETLYISVGGQGSAAGTGGWNGGGAGGTSTAGGGCKGGPAGGGGGMSDVRQGGMAVSNIVIAAAGGGGSGRDYCNGTCVPCGCGGGSGGGGGSTGTAGGAAFNCGYGYPGSGVNGGGGGTQTGGGTAGPGDGAGTPGTVGSQATGGGGAAGTYDVAGGGGGGGYYGGGGGGGAASGSGVGGGGGGGGSSYIGGVTGGSTTAGTQSGDGQITITW